MKLLKAMAYLTYVSQLLVALANYRIHKDESLLANDLSVILREALKHNGIRTPLSESDEQRLHDDLVDIVDIFEGTLY